MDAIVPFDYGSLVPFSLAYMPGYLAERFDEDAEANGSMASMWPLGIFADASAGTCVKPTSPAR